MREKHSLLDTSPRPLSKPPRLAQRPLSAAELRVRLRAENALERAKACAAMGNLGAAVSYCLGGLESTFGFSRPFAVRDQIDDFMREIDPDGSLVKAHVLAAAKHKADRGRRYEREEGNDGSHNRK